MRRSIILEQQLRHMAGQLDGSLISLDGYAAVIELPFGNIHRVFECWQNTNFVPSPAWVNSTATALSTSGSRWWLIQAAAPAAQFSEHCRQLKMTD
jgi:hypothetical protein